MEADGQNVVTCQCIAHPFYEDSVPYMVRTDGCNNAQVCITIVWRSLGKDCETLAQQTDEVEREICCEYTYDWSISRVVIYASGLGWRK